MEKHDLGNPEAYHLFFKTIKNFDKHIAVRYGEMRGSGYFITVDALPICRRKYVRTTETKTKTRKELYILSFYPICLIFLCGQ